MPEHDPYTIIEQHVVAGEEPTFAEVLDLLRVDAVAAAIFRAGSDATVVYLIHRIRTAMCVAPRARRSHPNRWHRGDEHLA
jgi:hypothetical protein